MTSYSVEPRDRIFVKCCGYLSFAKNNDKQFKKQQKQLMI